MINPNQDINKLHLHVQYLSTYLNVDRNVRKLSKTIINKPEITHQATRVNHIIDWQGATVVDKDMDRRKTC